MDCAYNFDTSLVEWSTSIVNQRHIYLIHFVFELARFYLLFIIMILKILVDISVIIYLCNTIRLFFFFFKQYYVGKIGRVDICDYK